MPIGRNDLAAVFVGAGIGAVIGMTALWSIRAELKQGWRERRAELFGAETETPDVFPCATEPE